MKTSIRIINYDSREITFDVTNDAGDEVLAPDRVANWGPEDSPPTTAAEARTIVNARLADLITEYRQRQRSTWMRVKRRLQEIEAQAIRQGSITAEEAVTQ